ncbi:NAD(P)/FAD-dependent oxidoreductase [Pseudomonas sp. BGr12]|uniref:NAD(P)/FAD-dependent oxidoreductase n=1 Tax=Pseudomonas sp. BGr12 TaxID=2936269 RepID=UPI002559998F|nr:FAD-dependent oxidoreductase [Pseudomonas sp. BJa5]MDL2428451.1 FAD-dependent oxidoreductase [Pseudomonas sp. BJa5]
MNTSNDIVVIGAGQAGLQIAASLRLGGHTGRLVMIGDETNAPYQRPPLSKAFLKQQADEQSIQLRPATFFQDNQIELVCGETVSKIDRAHQVIETTCGKTYPYAKLAIATGTRPRPLDIPGSDLEGVHLLRSFLDAANLRDELNQLDKIVIIGGGFIGLEVAACAASLGKQVTVLEYAPRIMGRAVSPISSDFFQRHHTRLGVEVITEARIEYIGGDVRTQYVQLVGGRKVEADLVLVGVGALPNIELAQAAGLACSNGIVVDEFAVTTDPKIVAAGDCTSHPNKYAGGRFRLESVQNAIDQAKVAAQSLLGSKTAYDVAPWFWSDQGEIKLQTVGLPLSTDLHVVRGNPAESKFSVFHFRGERLTAVESINSPADHMVARRLLAQGVTPDPAYLVDPNFELKFLLIK